MSQKRKLTANAAFPIGVLGAASTIAFALAATRPAPPRTNEPAEPRTLVEVTEVQAENHSVHLHAKGTVVPAEEVIIKPQLTGRVIWSSSELINGGRFKKGDPILKIDPRDYQLSVDGFRAEVNQAKLDLAVEERRGEIAKREWNAFGDIEATEAQKALAQRKPYLDARKIALSAAQSSLRQAQLDLSRTTLRAPFNSEVLSETVDVGQLVASLDEIARLVGTDAYHVQVSVPVGSLRTIMTRADHGTGSHVSVVQRVGEDVVERDGEVIRTLSDLDPGGAMARVLVRIDNPAGEVGDLPLLLGSYVEVAVEAQAIEQAIRLPRESLRDGQRVYVMNEQDQLEIRDVHVVWNLPDAVLVDRGLESGDRVVTSRVSTPVPNMRLRTMGANADPASGTQGSLSARATP
ncbi:MAG: efflux RND transporter periplasmic adaptor subunit [Myxococcota bacterium]